MVTITGPNGETFETPAWTVHCRFGSKGAYFHPGLGLDQELFRPMSEQDMVIHREIDERGAVVATQKAHGYESYGDFFTVFGTITPAGEYMRQLILSAADQGITDLDYVTSGLATNYCVEATVVQLYELLEQIRNANPELTLPNINVHLANDLTEAIPDPEMDMDVEKTRIASIGRMAEKAQEYADKGLNVTFESKPFEELSADIEKWKEARSTDPSIATAIDTVLQTSRGYSMDRRTEAAANFTASKEGIKAVNKQSFLGNTIETLAQLTSQTVDAVQDKLMGSRS